MSIACIDLQVCMLLYFVVELQCGGRHHRFNTSQHTRLQSLCWNHHVQQYIGPISGNVLMQASVASTVHE